MSNVAGRVILVTGGSRGIGNAIVQAFLDRGDRVAACATTEDGARASGAHLGMQCDVADAESVQQMIRTVLTECGRLDVVVNNAGVAGTNTLDVAASDALWQRILDVNLTGTYLVSKHALPHLPDGSGRLINVASILGLRGAADQTAYTAAKHGVVGFTRALAQLVGPRGITVNAVCPGWVRSDMARQRWSELGIDEGRAAAAAPVGRIVEPREVADLVVYLASASAGSITGQALSIDGGTTA